MQWFSRITLLRQQARLDVCFEYDNMNIIHEILCEFDL